MNYQLDFHAEELMEQYRERLPLYRQLADMVDEAVRKALKEQHVTVTVMEHRVKTESSLAGKLELKGAKYRTIDDVTDIVGMRVVTFYSADVDKVAAIVNELFDVDWYHSVDKRKLHRLDSFGYNSLHYICRLKPTLNPSPGGEDGTHPINSSPRGKDGPRDESSPQGGARGGLQGTRGVLYSLPFEIQMRTALQHVWSTIDHDTAYKDGGVKIPNEYQRQFNRLAGMLELIDDEFSRLRNALTDYRRQMLALEASGQLDEVDLNSNTFRRYLDMHPFARLNERIAAINQAELYPVPLMPFLRVFQKLGLETLGDVNRLINEYSDEAYSLAAAWLGATDLDILSESIAPQNLCYVYVLKQGGGLKELCQLLDWIKGPDEGNTAIAKDLLVQARTLHL